MQRAGYYESLTIVCSESADEDLRCILAWKPVSTLVAEDLRFKDAAEIRYTVNGIEEDMILLREIEEFPIGVRRWLIFTGGPCPWQTYRVDDLPEAELRAKWAKLGQSET